MLSCLLLLPSLLPWPRLHSGPPASTRSVAKSSSRPLPRTNRPIPPLLQLSSRTSTRSMPFLPRAASSSSASKTLVQRSSSTVTPTLRLKKSAVATDSTFAFRMSSSTSPSYRLPTRSRSRTATYSPQNAEKGMSHTMASSAPASNTAINNQDWRDEVCDLGSVPIMLRVKSPLPSIPALYNSNRILTPHHSRIAATSRT